MSFNVSITLLTDSSSIIIVEIAKLGYKLSLWQSNETYFKTSNGPGGITVFMVEPKKDISSKEVLHEIRDLLEDNLIPYFSLSVWENAGSSFILPGDLKPIKKEKVSIKKQDKKKINPPNYLKVVK